MYNNFCESYQDIVKLVITKTCMLINIKNKYQEKSDNSDKSNSYIVNKVEEHIQIYKSFHL